MDRSKLKYITKEKSLVGNTVYGPGEEVFYEGLPAENLIPTCDEGRARYQEYIESNMDRVTKMNRAFAEQAVQAAGGDHGVFAKAFAAELARANAAHAETQAAMLAQMNALATKIEGLNKPSDEDDKPVKAKASSAKAAKADPELA